MIAIMRNPVSRVLLAGSSLLFSVHFALSQDQTTPPQTTVNQTSTAAVGTVRGLVKSGNMPIPGAAVSISQTSSGTIVTWTDVDGTYSAAIHAYGTYTVGVQMVAFANSSQQVVVDASHPTVQANFELTLLSRTPEAIP